MPRPLQVALTLALYAAMMGAAWWVLKSTLPGVLEEGRRWIGVDGVTVVMVAAWLAAVAYVIRDSARRRRTRRSDR